MLSRVAERLYWVSRYLERAENAARMINAHFQLTLDMPKGQEPGWETLVDIFSSQRHFSTLYSVITEQNIARYLLVDKENPSSLINSVLMARENARTTRDLVTPQMWEELNALRLYCEQHAEKAVQRRYRYRFLEDIIKQCQQIDGLINSVISRTAPYRFLQLGKYIERADMTSRMLDQGVTTVKRMLSGQETDAVYRSLLWMHILISLNALNMYRHRIGPGIDASAVIYFLLKDTSFPRSVGYCVEQIGFSYSKLPNRLSAIASFSRLQDQIMDAEGKSLAKDGLHHFMDDIQIALIEQNDIISHTWFGHA